MKRALCAIGVAAIAGVLTAAGLIAAEFEKGHARSAQQTFSATQLR
jgi:hypothetical protein